MKKKNTFYRCFWFGKADLNFKYLKKNIFDENITTKICTICNTGWLIKWKSKFSLTKINTSLVTHLLKSNLFEWWLAHELKLIIWYWFEPNSKPLSQVKPYLQNRSQFDRKSSQNENHKPCYALLPIFVKYWGKKFGSFTVNCPRETMFPKITTFNYNSFYMKRFVFKRLILLSNKLSYFPKAKNMF